MSKELRRPGIAQFEKVSKEQFAKDFAKEFPHSDKKTYDEIIKLPTRATTGSAGYDFVTPISFTLKPNQAIKIPTGIRCKMNEDWVLVLVPRSGLGFKYQLNLCNTLGIIDADFAYSDNEGHIMVKLVNRGDKDLQLNAGDRFCQGIFLPYGTTVDDNCEGVRNGGFGSTDKNN